MNLTTEEKFARLELKHRLAVEYSLKMCEADVAHVCIPQSAFNLAEEMVERMSQEHQALVDEVNKVAAAHTVSEFDPVQHFMDSLMSSIAKQNGRTQ